VHLDACTHRLLERVDVAEAQAYVRTQLVPLYEGPERPAWSAVAERSRFIGTSDRPPDVGYRKMRPSGYVQLCLVNDEVPPSPWALAVPPAAAAAAAPLEERVRALCRLHFGAGELHFCVFAVLAPGGAIPTHRDMPHDVNKKRFSHHLHWPLLNAGDTEYTIAGETFRMEEGGLYEIDNMVPHATANRGDTYRVNLMIDWTPAHLAAERARPSPPGDPRGGR
jgi:hypothetical protein